MTLLPCSIFQTLKETFKLKSRYTVPHENVSSAISETSFGNFFVKFGYKTPRDMSYDILWPFVKCVKLW